MVLITRLGIAREYVWPSPITPPSIRVPGPKREQALFIGEPQDRTNGRPPDLEFVKTHVIDRKDRRVYVQRW